MNCDEPRPAPNEKTQPIQWTERPTGALVAAGSLWPSCRFLYTYECQEGPQIREPLSSGCKGGSYTHGFPGYVLYPLVRVKCRNLSFYFSLYLKDP
jgi:hypothetical protein